MNYTGPIMDQALEMLSHPFSLGLLLGLVFFGLSCTAHFKTKIEFRRYRKILGDKMEVESQHLESLRKEKAQLSKENENLRVRSAQTSNLPAQRLERELEILARAEKQMVINAPGFAPAWENAKSQALSEIEEEERGATLPRRIFKKFFGSPRELAAESTSVSTSDAPTEPLERKPPQGVA